MEPKKSKKAQLENKKGLYIQVGLVIALSLILISFEWTSNPPMIDDIALVKEIEYVEEIILIPRDEKKEEKVEPKTPDIVEVIEIVEDDEEDDPWTFETEVNRFTVSDFGPDDNGDEFIPDDTPYIVVEDMPTFMGGDPKIEFRNYIARNMKYPGVAAENGIMGLVRVQFCVDSKGKVVDAIVTRSVDPALDKEALRVILASPKWEPGKQRGKPVKVLFTFPINYVLQ